MRVALAAFLAIGALAGCGGDLGGEAAAGPPGGRPSGPSGPAVTVAVPDVLAEVPTIELTEPGGTNVGELPRFAWLPVEAAAEYRLVVTGASGPLWAWQGPDTTVRFGGVDDPEPGYIGIRLTEPGWWSVSALDADGAVVALSPRRSVSPDDRTADEAAPSVGGGGSEQAEAAGPIDPTTVDPCTLLSVEEVSTAFGAPVHPGELMTGGGGNYRSCTWVSTLDELKKVHLSLDNRVETYNPTGWTHGEPGVVEDLGEEAFIVTDFGVRVGWLRAEVAATVHALQDHTTAPTWIELARTVEERLNAG